MGSPSIAAVIPTFNAARTLELALRTLRGQRYDGELEILCVDGGSTDGTHELAARYDARVIENERRLAHYGYARGIEVAEAELVLVLDADAELPHAGWLERHVRALDLAEDIVAADPLFHTWRRQDPAIVRLMALMGGTDPIAIDLGWHERWSFQHDRWTGMPVQQEDIGDALLVRLDPRHTPPMGTNGFLVRRAAVIETAFDPFYHPEVVAQLAERGWRFARVRDSIIHHFAPTTIAALRKTRSRARETMRDYPERTAHPTRSPLRLAQEALWSLTLVGPCWQALRGFRRRRDPAWALYPLLHAAWTISYMAEAALRLAQILRRAPSLERA